MPRLEAKDATYPVIRHNFEWGKIQEINYEDDTCKIVIVDKDKMETSEVYEDVPIFYHCYPDVKKRDNGALEGASSAFARDDFVLVRFEDDKPIVVARLDGLVPCLDVILWGDKTYALPNLNETWDKTLCSGIYGICPENRFVYLFSNTFKFSNHFVTIMQTFSIRISEQAPWMYGNMHYVEIQEAELFILTEKGLILTQSSDGYWLDYTNDHICIIKRIYRSKIGYIISLLRYSSDGTFINEDKTIIAKNYELGNYDLNHYRLLCDKHGNIYAYSPNHPSGHYPRVYYRTTWQDFPESWEEIKIDKHWDPCEPFRGNYLKTFEQDIYQHDIIIDEYPKIIEDFNCVQQDCHVVTEMEEENFVVPSVWTYLDCFYPFLGNYYQVNGGVITIHYHAYLKCLDNTTAQFQNFYYGSICKGNTVEQVVVEGPIHTVYDWDMCADCEKNIWLYYGDGYVGCDPALQIESERTGKNPFDPEYIIKIPYLYNNIFAVTKYYLYHDINNYDKYMLIKTPEYHIDKEISENPLEEALNKGLFYFCHSELEDKNGNKWIFDSKYIDKEQPYFEYTLKKNYQIIDIEIENEFKYWILTLQRLIKSLQ
ncbi:hypothetical protein J7J62_03845 [bacterium]|nr:hypothetical protein [bacterium]